MPLRVRKTDPMKFMTDCTRHGLLGAVEPGKGAVGEGVIGVDETNHTFVAGQQILGEQTRLPLHRRLQVLGVVFGKHIPIRGHVAQASQVQPCVGESGDKTFGARVGEKALSFRPQDSGI